MTLNKKNWLKLSLLGLLVAIGTGGSCAEDTVPEEETPTTLSTVYEGREIKIGNSALEIAQMTKSGDNKFIYTRSIDNKALYAHKVGAKTAAPVALTIASKPADPATVGKADLKDAINVVLIIPTDTGVMASVNSAVDKDWGVALFEGDEATADTTWITNKDDDIYSAGNSVGNRTEPTYGFMVYKMEGTLAKQAPYIFSPAKSGFFTVDGPSALGTKLAKISTRASTPLDLPDYIIGHKASGSAYMIDNLGVARIAPANVNGATNNTNIPLAVADGTGDDANKKGFKNFNLMKSDGTAGNDLNDQPVTGVTIVGHKLYIAFTSSGTANGGVAVVELNAANGELGAVHAPSHNWGDFTVLHLTKDGNNVYAVAHPHATANDASIFEVTATADKGAELSDWLNAKAAGANTNVIQGGIQFAELAGDELYVATSSGFFNITKKTVAK